MRKKLIFILTTAVAVITSCSSNDSIKEGHDAHHVESHTEVEAITYTLNQDVSILNWKGTEGEHEFHTGTLLFSDGSVTVKESVLENGSVVVDMNSMTVTDEGMPNKSKNKLIRHLSNDDFFDAINFPSTNVTLNSYENGELAITLNVMDKVIETSAKVDLSIAESEVHINGDFTVDFSSLESPGFEPKEDEDESISPVVQFTIDVSFVK